ncbi:Tad domain-containing protein [Aestuariibius insulae]|uniref:Tad domain-containing protein n=1 Tax=Aestuariibius insulae TaxID=2058287 RepID=UPI00345EB50D
MMIFSLFIFLMMIMAGSLAVDFMRLESERARLQTSIDRAVLAGAALDQTLDQREVITDYLKKSGVKGYVPDDKIVVVNNGRERSAKVTGIVNLDTVLMQFIGINQLAAAAAAKADESTPHIEISLVLDISGSMGRNGRIEKLREAAEGFVNIIIEDAQDANTSSLKTISIVPYSATVNVGEDLMDFYNVDGNTDHPYSNCVEFEDSAFETTALSKTLLLQQYPHFDNRNNDRYEPHEDHASVGERQLEAPRCRRAADVDPNTKVEDNAILAFQTQAGDNSPLVEHIRDLTADGSTSIDIGLKWGLALLDPGSRDVNADLRTANIIEDLAQNRPLDFDTSEATTRKILVLMTDGMMNWVVPPRQEFRDRPSNVFFDEDTGFKSVLLRGQITTPDGVTAPMERVSVSDKNDNAPGNEWYWVEEEEYMPWPDTPAARVAWLYLNESDEYDSGDRFDTADLIAVMNELPNADYNDVRTTDEQNEDKALWDSRADWAYLLDGVDPPLTRLSHPDLFDRYEMVDLRDDLLEDLYDDGELSDEEWAMYQTLWADAKDNENAKSRMLELCNIAKGLTPDSPQIADNDPPLPLEMDDTNDRNVTIYSVAMNLSGDTAARDLMRNCATRGEKYFKDTNTAGIVDAFKDIALDVKALRLTQ